MRRHFGFILFPDATQLDLTAPFEVFARCPDVEVHLIWKTPDPVRTDRGMTIVPTTTFAECPSLDLVCVPGGPGQIALMDDEEVLSFLRACGKTCTYITSVCTGSLVLGAAGLLQGYSATCHWAAHDQLALLGAVPVDERVVQDRNRITGAGVTSGLDFALTVAAAIFGKDVAQKIQLQIEYDPQPPFACGSRKTATDDIVESLVSAGQALRERRLTETLAAARKLT